MDGLNSVHVGGLSYESSEDAVKRAFLEFGEVVSVKIVHDRESGESRGFGFVSFTNPRSATMAIRDMDGGQIEGRTIRVNEVRRNSKGLGFRDRNRDFKSRDMRQRIRRRRSLLSREHIHHRTGSPVPQRSHTPTAVRSSPAVVESSPRRGNSPFVNPGGYQSREVKERERSRSARSSVSPQCSERNEMYEEFGHQESSKLSSSTAARKNKEDVCNLQEELEIAMEKGRGLEEKVESLRSVLEKADVTIAALKSKSQKLKESLANAQQQTAHRQFQLRRLQTGVFQYKLCMERVSNSEMEMEALAATTCVESEHGFRRNSNLDVPPPLLANGQLICDKQHHNDDGHSTNLLPA